MATREVTADELPSVKRRPDALYAVEWTEVALPSPNGAPRRYARVAGERAIAGIDAERYDDLPSLAAALADGGSAPDAVIVDMSPSEKPDDVRVRAHENAARTLSLVQDVLGDERLAESRLVVLTHLGVAARDGDDPELSQAALWGLLRSAQSEHPDRFLLVDTDGSEASGDALARALTVTDEPQLALRAGTALCPRLARIRLDPDDAQAPELDPDKTVLITGATGGVGVLVARHLAHAHGARHLLLLSRRGPQAESAAGLRAELEELGAQVDIVACDVADRQALEGVLAGIPADHPLGVVVHAAGLLDDGVVEALDAGRLERVFAPKLDGALHLHELTRDSQLSHFVLFSSQAGVFGNPGQANYAAANAFLDALAAHRRAQGLSATALAWGLWRPDAEAGAWTASQFEDVKRQLHTAIAMLPLESDEGLELLDLTLELDHITLAPLRLDLAALRDLAREGVLPPLLRGLVRAPARRAAGGSLAERLASVPAEERDAVVLQLVRAHVATVMGQDSPDQIEPDRAFKELGFDSLGAVELRNRLAQATGLRLPTTLVFDHPNAAAVARYLLSEIQEDSSAGVRVDEEADKLEAMLASIAGDDEARARAEARLRRLDESLRAFLEGDGNGSAEQREDGDKDLASASDRELFDILDEELGSR